MSNILHRQLRSGTLPVVLSFVLAMMASMLLLVLPVYSSASQESIFPAGSERSQEDRATLVEVNGQGTLLGLAVPVIIAGSAVALNWTRVRRPAQIVAAILLVAIVVVSIASIGLVYSLSAAAMIVAAANSSNSSS